MGRFINADAFTSTGQGILGNNMFVYCLNNPMEFFDPNGAFPWHIVAGAVIGGGVSALCTGVTGGSFIEIVKSGFRGALVGGATATYPNTATAILVVDITWTVVEVLWDSGTFGEGITAGLIHWLFSFNLVNTEHKQLRYVVELILNTSTNLTSSAVNELVMAYDNNSGTTNDASYGTCTSFISQPSSGGGGHGSSSG